MNDDAAPGLARQSSVRTTERVPAGLRIERVPITHPDAQALIEAVQAEYVARYGGQDESPIDPADFEDPLGQFFVAYLCDADADDAPVATGAWRRSSVEALGAEVTAEVKRMYVVPSAQRRGVARRMLAHLEATAAAAGVEAMVLETGMRQPEAIALYESSGYEPIPGFGYYCGSELSRCFGRRI